MIMRRLYAIWISMALALGACSDFTEIDPKGKNILNRVEDLDLLLNYEYYISASDIRIVVNDGYPGITNIPNLLNESIKTLNGIYTSWDETADRVALTTSDDTYSGLYQIIGQVANPVLQNVDEAAGDRAMADRLKAEALVLRAWCHYCLVNIYAKAYDPATAETDPGIVYRVETDEMQNPNEKLTVEEVYGHILADLDSALNLGSLPVTPNKMRVGLPFAYAAKAKVLMSMRDYDGAFEAAGESLELKSTIDDYNDLLAMDAMFGSGLTEFTRPELELEEELFDTPVMVFYDALPDELWEAFEEGHILKEYLLTDLRMYGSTSYGYSFYGLNTPLIFAYYVYYSPLGLTTVDMYLTQAECYIREGNITGAMELLNKIRENRIVEGQYTEKTASSAEEAFAIMKNISRTENFATLKNFINMKRWNTEPAYQETLRKTIEWDVYVYDGGGNVTGMERRSWSGELTPDSPLWIFPFPQNATTFNSNLTQNYETNN